MGAGAIENAAPNARATTGRTSPTGTGRSSSRFMLVTGFPSPQALITVKWSRSGATFSAKPCIVTLRLTATPPRDDPECAEGIDERHLQEADVTDDILVERPEVDDRVPHELTGAVVGHIAPAFGLVHFEPARGEQVARSKDVGRPARPADR